MTPPTTRPPYHLFVGVDIAAATFTAAWTPPGRSPSPPRTFDQTPTGFAAFQQHLQATDVPPAATLVVLEATGSYWVALAVTLHQAGYVVSILNPAQVHSFAKAQLRRAKTDALDAQLLTQFAVERQPSAWTPPPAVYHELRQRLLLRDSLVDMRQQARNQRHALLHWPVVVAGVRQQLEELIADLSRRIKALEAEIEATLQAGEWAASATYLQRIKGIGPLTAAWILVATLNFTLCQSPEAATAYAGLAPQPHESGTSVKGRRQIGHAGNGRLRTALYMATMSAAQHNPVIQPFYDRLRAAGKPMKVARCAAARKLLHLAWAVVTKQQCFRPYRDSSVS
jgi:transposase